MTVLALHHPRVPFVDSRGFIAREWQLFLSGLYTRVGGPDSATIPEVVEMVDALALVVAELDAGHVIEDEGIALPQQDALNFVGAGVTVTDSGGKTVVTIPGGGVGGGHVIEDEGVALPQQTTMNFVGAGVTVTDAGGKTVVTIPGGGGGGGGNSYWPSGW